MQEHAVPSTHTKYKFKPKHDIKSVNYGKLANNNKYILTPNSTI